MRTFTIALAVSLAIAGVPACAQEIKTHHVKDNIYMLEGRGGNIGVSIGDDGVLIVDDQFKPLAERIQAAISKLGGDAPKFLLSGSHIFAKFTGTILNLF